VFYLVVGAVVLGVLLVAGVWGARDRRLDEVDRFHRARRLTSRWAEEGPPPVVYADDALV